jgi:hypothetical protein
MKISPQRHRVNREWTRIDANKKADLTESNGIRIHSWFPVPLRVLCVSVVKF